MSNLKKFGGDKIKAVQETYPAQQMLKEAHEFDSKVENKPIVVGEK